MEAIAARLRLKRLTSRLSAFFRSILESIGILAPEVDQVPAMPVLPQELKDVIFNHIIVDTLGISEDEVEIMNPRFDDLKSLLRVNHQIRAATKDVMRRKTLIKAICHTWQDSYVAAKKAQKIFGTSLPFQRRMQIDFTQKEGDPTFMNRPRTWLTVHAASTAFQQVLIEDPGRVRKIPEIPSKPFVPGMTWVLETHREDKVSMIGS